MCSQRVHETPYAPNLISLGSNVSLHLVSAEKYTACVHILKGRGRVKVLLIMFYK